MKYRPAIIKAIEDLKDVLGSSSAKIQKYIQEVIYPENTSEWFNSLFLRTLKNMKKSGDLVEQNLRFKLSPQLEKKIAEAAEFQSSSKGKALSGGTKDKRKRKKVIPVKKTTRAKAKIEPRQTKIRKQRNAEPMELRHEIPESFSGEEKSTVGTHKSGESQPDDKKRGGGVIVFSPKLKAEKAAMKIEKVTI